jgi:hypothetical protein
MRGRGLDRHPGFMLDPDQLVLCEHEFEVGECPICAGAVPDDATFDPHAWVEAYAATARPQLEVPADLVGVPLG